MEKEIRVVAVEPKQPTKGSVGLESQLPGTATTVSGVAENTGGIGGWMMRD